jgi:DNA helicase-2/ATP-dependent DNA helicase PcrA
MISVEELKVAKATAIKVNRRAEAIGFREGKCLVIAGPGAGKTRIIVERFCALLEEKVDGEKLHPSQILALTYNRKAADEMLDRVEKKLGQLLPGDPVLTTYHAFAQRVVGRYARFLGHKTELRIASDAEAWKILSDVVAKVKPAYLYEPTRPYESLSAIRGVIQRAKQELVTPEGYVEWAQVMLPQAEDAEKPDLLMHLGIAECYRELNEIYRERGVLDHDDTILLTAELLDKEAVVKQFASEFKYVMVDEYQDTNTAQAVMVERLVAENGNLLVVADDDQSIYKFRGASRVNLERFKKTYPEYTEIPLLTNHRSTPEIIEAAQSVIEVASGRNAKVVKPYRASGKKIRLIQCFTREDEAIAIIERCKELSAQGIPWREMAVLFRNHNGIETVSQALQHHGIPYIQHGGRDFFRGPEIKNVMALLGAIADPLSDQNVLRCLFFPNWRMSRPGQHAAHKAIENNPDLRLIKRLEKGTVPGLEADDVIIGQKMAEDLWELNELSHTLDVRYVFQEALNRTRYAGILDTPREIERLQVSANLAKFKSILDDFSFAADSGGYRLDESMKYIEILQKGAREGAAPLPGADEIDAVQLATIHSVKGLEFAHVIIGGLVEGKLPSRNYADPLTLPDALVEMPIPEIDGHLEEERRLFYVGLTRAKDSLTLTHAQRYGNASNGRIEQRSSFVDLIPKSLIDAVEMPMTTPVQASDPAELVRNSKKLNLSYSSLSVFATCPKQYWYRSIQRLTEKDSTEAGYGRMIHNTLENAAQIVQTGELVDETGILHLWKEVWDSQVGTVIGQTDELYEFGEKMLQAYVQSDLWQKGTFDALEYPFSLELNSGTILKGRFDRIENRNGVVTVVDYKTGIPKTSNKLSADLQLYVYAVAAAEIYQVDEISCELHYLRDASSTTVYFDKIKLEKARKRLGYCAADINEAHVKDEFPAKPSNFACASCSFRVLCDEKIV